MPGDVSELIGRDKHVVCRGLDEIDYENIGIVSGVPIPKAELLNMKCLIATEHVIVLRVIKMKGFVDPVHQHDDHDTVSTLVSGRLMNLSRTRFPWTQNWLNRSVQGGPEHDR